MSKWADLQRLHDVNKGRHILDLFDESLEKLGYLVLGSKENIRFSHIVSNYDQPDPQEKIWRKLKSEK